MSKFYGVFLILLIPACQGWHSHRIRKQVNDGKISSEFSTPEECRRQCRDDEKPKTCYYKFTIEYYPVIGLACTTLQERNSTDNNRILPNPKQCVLADGVEKTAITINRMMPGPAIEVCLNDMVVVDVDNAAEGIDVTIHWHGVFQNGFPYSDGVPMVTQCPILSGTTFRYFFVVNNPGTHFYHSHEGEQIADGVQGSLVVKEPPSKNPFLHLYDADCEEYIIHLSDWMHQLSGERFPGRRLSLTGQTAQNFLINGRGKWTDPQTGQTTNIPLATFTISKGKTCRFRLINSFATVCSVEVTIQSHTFLVIAQDGENNKPVSVDRLVTSSGERVDFLLNANQTGSSFWIRLRGLGECQDSQVQQFAILQYDGEQSAPSTTPPSYYDQSSIGPRIYNTMNVTTCADGNTICAYEMKTLEKDPDIARKPDELIALAIGFSDYNDHPKVLYRNSMYPPHFVALGLSYLLSNVNNMSYVNPPVPLIWGRGNSETMCKPRSRTKCTQPCTCTQVFNIPLDSVVKIIIYDIKALAGVWHPFHMHGYSFHVCVSRQPANAINATEAQALLHSSETDYSCHLSSKKDTIVVPTGGYVILKFKADNPGWWFFHCHFAWHTATGMNVVLHVGEQDDLPPVPRHFPYCDNYLPSPSSWNDGKK